MSHTHDHDHDHDHNHDHTHDHDHDHQHQHRGGGIIGLIGAALHLPGFGHDHDHGYAELAADTALQDNALGIRTVWLALLALGITTVLQIIIYVSSGSVALLADTVHNLGDALNSIPLLVAFYLARRAATRRYTYGFGRAEDVAGILIVVSIAFSAGYILWESVQKLLNPQPLTHLPWVAAAAVIGFIGNELVALMQLNVGRRIGSAAMVADGQHARVDGLTSLAVLVAVAGTAVGLPILDPLIGIVIGIAIVGITWNAVKTVWYRLMDAVDPELIHRMEHLIEDVHGVDQITRLRARWNGHRLYVDTVIAVTADLTFAASGQVADQIRASLRRAIPTIGDVTVEMQQPSPIPTPAGQ